MFITSEFLIDILNDEDRLDVEREKKELPEILQERKLKHEELMKSVEGLCSGTPLSVLGWPSAEVEIFRRTDIGRDILESLLDDCFCFTLVNQIPTMVSRALRMDPLVISEYPEGPVNIYLREATRAYLLGLFIASVALSRSALEQALEEKVSKGLQTDSKEERLKKLIKAAELLKLLRGENLYLADQVRKQANKVVHGRPCKEGEAFGDADAGARGEALDSPSH
ncbi:MAG: hypothetical protein IH846_14145 [Acidobacteria bacterium]|nr:hypothetical protein [Acidobacteriota bacterium]